MGSMYIRQDWLVYAMVTENTKIPRVLAQQKCFLLTQSPLLSVLEA